jgi:aminoglycoside 3-N-acetyltransferase
MSGKSKYIEGLQNLGLGTGDTVLVHSSLIEFNWKEYGGMEEFVRIVFDSLREVVGETGTLMFPVFNFSFSNDSPEGYWSLDETKSDMGVLTEYVRHHEDSVQTVHPFYSFAIVGDKAGAMGKIHSRDTFSEEYIFGEVHSQNAQILVLGLEYNDAMTFFHYVEQQEGVDYRFKKDFHGTIDIHGKEYYETYWMMVRDLDRGVETHVNPMGEQLEADRVISTATFGGAEAKLGRAQEIYDATAQKMAEEPTLLYREADGT